MSENRKKPEESPHVATLRKQDKLNRLAKERFRVAGGKIEKYKAAPAGQDIETAVAAVAAAEERARLANLKPGDVVKDGSIFLGTWAPKDNEGRSLGKIFNVYAAPQDLTEKKGLCYADTVDFIAGLEGWHGYDGEDYFTDKELRAALKDGSYAGGWFIPPRELLTGKDAQDKEVQADNLFAHQEKGALRGAFGKLHKNGVDYTIWYWSSTEHPVDRRRLYNARFSDGSEAWDSISGFKLRCRPMRLELRS